ncbi:ATP-dependent zinc protease [Erythrobacteraceae bacterium E2-1 Yellow Sea]|nr:ATP-dependent zinc protease [Erythrobacteraceae bacterium E2-1 Yellow Sea]
MAETRRELERVGWREMIALPALVSVRIPAKIDTGARTSSLHAEAIERFQQDGQPWVRFELVLDEETGARVTCELPRTDRRRITSSNGQTEIRPIIQTSVEIGSTRFNAEFSLADRSDMKFPCLIGRSALKSRFLVDSGRSYLQSDTDERKSLLNQGQSK